MNPKLASLIEPFRRLDPERFQALRPAVPSVAVELDRDEMVLVRLRRRRRGRPELEAHASRPAPAQGMATSVLRPNLAAPIETSRAVRELYEASGTRPGRVTLVLPDNLARVSLLNFPERPATRRHLDEMVRFKLRRSVPFRLEEAVISYQALPDDGKDLNLLVALMLRPVVEQYEDAFEAAGARTGRVELSTLCLFNLLGKDMEKASSGGGDAALLNCSQGYFSLMIVRNRKLLFYRCKSLRAQDAEADDVEPAETSFHRELATSVSYYQEKLGGEGIATTFVRDVTMVPGGRSASLEALGFGSIVPVNPVLGLSLSQGISLDPAVAQRIAPAVGAAGGRPD